MIYRAVMIATVIPLVLCAASFVHAQAIATYDENSSPFLLGSYAGPGVVTLTPESILFDVPSNDDTFGIAGTLNVPFIDFDPGGFQWEVRFRILSGNDAQAFDVLYTDNDDDVPSNDEGWVFRFDLSSYTPTDDWIVLRQGFGNPIVVGTNDGVQNPGLVLMGLVREPATTARFHMELDYLRIIPIPEPCSLALGCICLALAKRLRGRRASSVRFLPMWR